MVTVLPRSLIRLHGHLHTLVRTRLWLQVMIGMALGIGMGVAIGPTAGWVEPKTASVIGNWVGLPGRLFLLGIQFVVIPLIVASVIRGIAAGENNVDLGRLGLWTVAFFVLTTVLAVAIGLGAATLIEPGRWVDGTRFVDTMAAAESAGMTQTADGIPSPGEIPAIIVDLFPKDPLSTFVSGNMLQIVITSAIFAVALVMTPADQRKPLLDLLASVQAACMVIVGFVLRFAPVAVFGMLANITAELGLAALISTAMYVVTVLAGLATLLVVYLALAWGMAACPPGRFLLAAREALLLAFSTSSSAAVMPVTMTTVENGLGVREKVSRFVVPLGTTINMGGTALYQGVATLFLAQVFGIDIGLMGMLLITIMAVGAAIGSPGTPGVGIIILATILDSVGIPAAGIAIIIGVDRLLDMSRTVVNVGGDIAACLVVDRRFRGADLTSATSEGPAAPA